MARSTRRLTRFGINSDDGHKPKRSIRGDVRASRPCLVMRSAMGPASASRRQASSEPGADLFQSDELIHGLLNRFARNVCRQVSSAIIAPRSRGQNDELGIGGFGHRDPPFALVRRHCRHPRSPPRPCSRRGRIPKRLAFETVTVRLCSRPNASPFWIMLLLVWGRLDHAIVRIPVPLPQAGSYMTLAGIKRRT